MDIERAYQRAVYPHYDFAADSTQCSSSFGAHSSFFGAQSSLVDALQSNQSASRSLATSVTSWSGVQSGFQSGFQSGNELQQQGSLAHASAAAAISADAWGVGSGADAGEECAHDFESGNGGCEAVTDFFDFNTGAFSSGADSPELGTGIFDLGSRFFETAATCPVPPIGPTWPTSDAIAPSECRPGRITVPADQQTYHVYNEVDHLDNDLANPLHGLSHPDGAEPIAGGPVRNFDFSSSGGFAVGRVDELLKELLLPDQGASLTSYAPPAEFLLNELSLPGQRVSSRPWAPSTELFLGGDDGLGLKAESNTFDRGAALHGSLAEAVTPSLEMLALDQLNQGPITGVAPVVDGPLFPAADLAMPSLDGTVPSAPRQRLKRSRYPQHDPLSIRTRTVCQVGVQPVGVKTKRMRRKFDDVKRKKVSTVRARRACPRCGLKRIEVGHYNQSGVLFTDVADGPAVQCPTAMRRMCPDLQGGPSP